MTRIESLNYLDQCSDSELADLCIYLSVQTGFKSEEMISKVMTNGRLETIKANTMNTPVTNMASLRRQLKEHYATKVNSEALPEQKLMLNP